MRRGSSRSMAAVHRRRCLKSKTGPKLPYESAGAAMEAVRELRCVGLIDVGEEVAVYFCMHCRVWHWGRKYGAKWASVRSGS